MNMRRIYRRQRKTDTVLYITLVNTTVNRTLKFNLYRTVNPLPLHHREKLTILTLRLLISYIYIYIYMEHLFLMFLDHTQRRTTVRRTPLDEWSARRRDLYLTTHDTHNRQISMPPVGFEPTISAGERPVVSVVCCQVEVSPTSWPLVQRSPTDYGASLCVI